eukprot:scaffold69034_cov64-Phaeocystis_antarctica.AAC.2
MRTNSPSPRGGPALAQAGLLFPSEGRPPSVYARHQPRGVKKDQPGLAAPRARDERDTDAMRNLLMLMADDERFDETTKPLFNGSLMRAMPQSLVCAPSRMSLLTGQRPHILGPVTNHATQAAYLHPSLV